MCRLIALLVAAMMVMFCPVTWCRAADLVLRGGKIVTVDPEFRVVEAMAVEEGRIVQLGTNAEIDSYVDAQTRVVELGGRMVLPGLIDSHVHPTGASQYEADHEIPSMETIDDVLQYVRERAAVVPKGEWIELQQVFITRLREQRFPTRQELDSVAPEHPVWFRTGPDGSANSLALAENGIDQAFAAKHPDQVAVDPTTGELTGVIRQSATVFKTRRDKSLKRLSQDELDDRLVELIDDYNRWGITGIIDRNCSDEARGQYARLLESDRLSIRVRLSRSMTPNADLTEIEQRLDAIAADPLFKDPDPRLGVIGVKVFEDGGMLTGSAYFNQPWGTSSIYGIVDPRYRGMQFIDYVRLETLVRLCAARSLAFTAHCQGDAAVEALVAAYERVNAEIPIGPTRSSITHSSFMSEKAIAGAAKLGIGVDLQPAWLYLDARTLVAQFGHERLKHFIPLRSLFEAGVVAGGGSDHMQKIGSLRSVNPYNPFLGMWVAVTRAARWHDEPIHLEQALSREQMIRFYTINNAWLMRAEDEVGSLEVGKRADFVVIDRDLLTCSDDDIRDTIALSTWLDGKPVFESSQGQVSDYSRTDLPPLLEFLDGRRVRTVADWSERREEIRQLLVNYFVGEFPAATPEIVESQIVSEVLPPDGSRRQRIRLTFSTPGQVSLEMALWTPPGEGPFPLLLCAPRYYQLPWAEDALSRGYAVCLFPGVDSHHQEPDFPGYESVWKTFQGEFPEATWTEISTKGWLASRCLDYLLSNESAVQIEPTQVAIIGFSRYGKMAMIAAAFDERISSVVARSPGSPGSSPYRLTGRDTFAETPVDFPGEWFLPSLHEFAGREDELPIDAHGWYALIAPRPCLIHTAYNDGSEPTFAVEKGWLEGRSVYRLLDAERKLHVDYRPGGHSSAGPENISPADRHRNLDWIDLSYGRGPASWGSFPTVFLHHFDWEQWRRQQPDDLNVIDATAAATDRLVWMLGDEPAEIELPDAPEFLTPAESELMTHDRWQPEGVQRVPIRFGDSVRGNLYFKSGLSEPAPVVVWLHPFSYHSGYNEGYGVEGTTVYHRLAQQGYAVIAYDQCGFGLRLLEGTSFYDRYPRWSRLGRMVRDARAAVSFAVDGAGTAQSKIPQLDPERVFLLGYSVGALTAMYAGALDERVAGTALFSGWTPMREADNRRLWLDHALLPRLGLFDQDQAKEIPIDYDEVLRRLARKPCLVVTPRRDRFADHDAIANCLQPLTAESETLTWLAPDTSNRFQSEQQELFVKWCSDLLNDGSR